MICNIKTSEYDILREILKLAGLWSRSESIIESVRIFQSYSPENAMHSVYKILIIPFEDLPLHINDNNRLVPSSLIKWRLTIGK